jgi:predicted DNA repair protein MutK
MAFASLFTLLDDITAVLDDVALMTKMAAKKTAGVVGDDLALNANQVTGVAADRELPIVWAVAKGSLINKVILVPLALAISYFAPWLVMPLLMIGGAYLCFEGVEKLLHKFTHKHDDTATAPTVMADELVDEKAKIRGAIRTDFILSAEIIIIALGVVAHMSMAQKAMVMSIIGIGMTVLVYGLVAGIVKLDDLGNWLQGKSSAAARSVGRGLILLMPWFMRMLAVVGMLAMFLVGGGIIVHGLAPVSEFLHGHHWENGLPGMLASLVVGVITGALVCAVVLPLMKLFNKSAAAAH